MDTPERGDSFYIEATQANRQMIAGQDVILVKDVSETGRYGRFHYLAGFEVSDAAACRQAWSVGMCRNSSMLYFHVH